MPHALSPAYNVIFQENPTMVSPVSKLPQSGTTIFTVMSKMAQESDAINLSQGFPDFDGPQLLRDRVNYHMNHGHNQYSPLAGVPALRNQIAAKVQDLYGCTIDPDTQVTVTPGATEALFCAISAIVHPADEVIVFDPAYDSRFHFTISAIGKDRYMQDLKGIIER